MNLNLPIKEVIVLTNTRGEDQIHITLDLPTTHPACGYEPCAKICVCAGYGIEWCRTNLGIEPEEIKCR